MSWPRGSLFTALLVLSIPLASADTITVNTTTDDYADNSLCSLREAVEYFNRDKPKDGFQGCSSATSNSSDSISVPASSKAYVIGSRLEGGVDRGAIVIRRDLSITGGGIANGNRTLLQVVGAHRAFVISNDPVVQPPDCATSVTAPCNPPGAPVLDAASDTDTPGDFLTTQNKPRFIVNVGPVPAGQTYTVTLYARHFASAADADPVVIASINFYDGTVDFGIDSNRALKEGVNDITYTLKINNGDESAHSPALRLGVHPTTPGRADVSISQMEIQGCITTTITDCANDVDGPVGSTSANGLAAVYDLAATLGKGGIFYVDDALDLNNVIIHDGAALAGPAQGGAIWGGDSAVVAVMQAEFRANSAAEGAAIYASKNSLGVTSSLFTGNTASPATGAVLTVADAAPPSGSTGASQISDSTLSGNDALAMSLRTGTIVSGSTIVLNKAGIDFNGQKVSVYNTILAGNPDEFPLAPSGMDCLNLPGAGNMDFRFSLALAGGGCDAATGGLRFLKNDNVGTPVPEEKLMAQADAAGKCVGYQPADGAGLDVFAGMGLLCPLAANNREENETTFASHLPRLLNDYVAASDSPIIGKGSTNTTGVDSCSGTDQRGKTRRSVCDIGAVELQAVSGPLVSGDAIHHGQTYTEALDSNLEDETLFRPSASNPCPSFAPTQPADALVPGCPWITVPPSRGTVVFNADGSYTYTPRGNYHGFDRFSFRVVTTLSKLNSDADSQSRLVNAQVIVEPVSGISAYSTSGSADIWFLLAGAGLALVAWRRGRELR